jgi:hypothetical protein
LLPISIEILFVVAEVGGDWGKEIVLHQSQYIEHLTRVKWEIGRQKDGQTLYSLVVLRGSKRKIEFYSKLNEDCLSQT